MDRLCIATESILDSGNISADLIDNTVKVFTDDNSVYCENGVFTYNVINSKGDLVASAGSSKVEYKYNAYGEKLTSNNTSNPIGYRNYYYDSETGLYYLKARYYDASTGQFTQEDTVQDDNLQYNLYGYCSGNPILYTDPNGHYSIADFNCYAYAFGYSDRWLIPGGSKIDMNGNLPIIYTVDYAADLVKKDFGNKVRKLNNKNSKINNGEYRIALRVSMYSQFVPISFVGPLTKITYDFHFWKQNPKTEIWWDKPGSTSIRRRGKANPNNKSNWFLGTIVFEQNSRNMYGNIFKKGTKKKLYYNSKTVYFAFNGKFWWK